MSTIPRQIGDFRIVRVLGTGGMGAVYEGVNQNTGEAAAIKVLLAHLVKDEELRQRFEAEIHTLKHLRHPNIVRLHGFGADAGMPYYVMELIDGPSLSQEIKSKRRFEWIEVAKIGLDLCRALRYAGDRGIIHRDLKPANIILSRKEGIIKLSDFGVAHFFLEGATRDLQSIIGTLEYMAPEQALGRPIGHKADLYALGVVMYALLSGETPYKGKTLEAIRGQHQAGTQNYVSIQQRRRDFPEGLAFLVDELLSIAPEKRPANANLVERRIKATLRALVGNPDQILLTTSDPQQKSLEVGAASADAATADLETSENKVATFGYQLAPSVEVTVEVAEIATENVEPIEKPESNISAESFSEKSAEKPNSHFIAVSEDELGHYIVEKPRVLRPLVVLKMLGMALTFFLLVGAMVYLLQPLPADEQARRIHERLEGKEDDDRLTTLNAAAPLLRSFVRSFPEDSRSAAFQSHIEEISAMERSRRLESRLARIDTRQLLPIERAYLQALSHQKIDHEKAAARLRAILTLYEENSQNETGNLRISRQQQVLEATRQQLAYWERSWEFAREQTRALIRLRLDEAKQLEETDPARAKKIREAILTLYGEKSWASELVAEARER